MDKRKRIRRTITKKIKSCEFNMDTGCVELRFADGRMISIDCTAVENEVADNRFQRSELDYLIYNDPLAYTPKQNNFSRKVRRLQGLFFMDTLLGKQCKCLYTCAKACQGEP